jgi:DNA-binding transcriptional LysR family regulator
MERAEQISRRLKLRQLDVLIAVARWGNMATAADHLAVSQPVVSKTIADLESTLGIRLFDRNRRGVAPTLYGRALIKRSVALFNDLRASVSELEFLSDPTAGELRIGSSEAVAAGMLGAIIDRLAELHPRLSFQVTLGAGLTDLQYGELRSHNLDLIIGRLPNVIEDDIQVEILYHDRMHVLAGATSPLARRRKIKLADLLDEPWCLPSLDTYPWTLMADAFRSAGLTLPRRIVTTRSVLLLTSLVASGRFVSALPRTVLHFCADRLQLKTLAVDLPMQSYPVGIVTLKDRTLSPAVQVFAEQAHNVVKPLTRKQPSFDVKRSWLEGAAF